MINPISRNKYHHFCCRPHSFDTPVLPLILLKIKMEYVFNNKNQIIGNIKDGILRKKVKGSKHQLQKPPAYGIDESVFQNKFEEVRILDVETNTVYKANRDVWTVHGFSQDRGHGLQRFLPLHNFNTYQYEKTNQEETARN